MKYCDKVLQPPLCLSKHIIEERVKILEMWPKSEETINFFPHIFVHLQTFIAIR